MAVRGYEPPPPTASAKVPADGIRHTGPLDLPWEGPKHRNGAAGRIAFAAGTVVLFLLAGAALFYLTGTGPGRPADAAAHTPPAGAATGSAAPGSATASPGRTASKPPAVDVNPPSGQRMPLGDIPGWHQTFTEDFTGDSLDDNWFAYSGQPGGDPAGWFDPGHVSVGGGMLTITGAKEQTPNGVRYATGGVSNHNVFSQTYGRFDVRFRMDLGVGIAYALLLWPTSNTWPPEVDIIEDNGGDRQSTSSTLHYDPDDKKIQRQTRADFTKWHTATLEWTPGHLVYLLDNKTWATITSSHVPDQPMDLALQTQAWGCGGTWEHCPNSTTPPVVNLQVDWVSIYEWTGP